MSFLNSSEVTVSTSYEYVFVITVALVSNDDPHQLISEILASGVTFAVCQTHVTTWQPCVTALSSREVNSLMYL